MTPIDLAEFDAVYSRPEALTDVYTHYCPGCTHGTAAWPALLVLLAAGRRRRSGRAFLR